MFSELHHFVSASPTQDDRTVLRRTNVKMKLIYFNKYNRDSTSLSLPNSLPIPLSWMALSKVKDKTCRGKLVWNWIPAFHKECFCTFWLLIATKPRRKTRSTSIYEKLYICPALVGRYISESELVYCHIDIYIFLKILASLGWEELFILLLHH